MSTNRWSKKFLAFVSGAMGVLSFTATTNANSVISPAQGTMQELLSPKQAVGYLEADFGKALEKADNNNADTQSSMASIEELQSDGKEIACGSRTGVCTSKFDVMRWTNYLINSRFRDPTRIGTPKFNASDMVYFYRRYGNAFGAYCATDIDEFSARIWIYKNLKSGKTDWKNLRGISEKPIPYVGYSLEEPREIQFDVKRMNQQIDVLNENCPQEVDAYTVVSSAFERMTGSKDGVANAKKYMDYMVASQQVADRQELINEAEDLN